MMLTSVLRFAVGRIVVEGIDRSRGSWKARDSRSPAPDSWTVSRAAKLWNERIDIGLFMGGFCDRDFVLCMKLALLFGTN